MVCNGMDCGRFWGFTAKHTLLQGAKQSPYFHVALTTKNTVGNSKQVEILPCAAFLSSCYAS